MFDGVRREQTLCASHKGIDRDLCCTLFYWILAGIHQKSLFPFLNARGCQLAQRDRMNFFEPRLITAVPVVAFLVAAADVENIGDYLSERLGVAFERLGLEIRFGF